VSNEFADSEDVSPVAPPALVVLFGAATLELALLIEAGKKSLSAASSYRISSHCIHEPGRRTMQVASSKGFERRRNVKQTIGLINR